VFKMHSIIMVPFAAPYKTMPFKYIHNYLRYPVFVFNRGIFVCAFAGPFPVVGISGVYINGHSKTMHAVPVRTANVSPGKGTADMRKIFFQFGMFVKFF